MRVSPFVCVIIFILLLKYSFCTHDKIDPKKEKNKSVNLTYVLSNK